MRKLLAAVIIAGVTACGPTELFVESDTEWAGFYGNNISGRSVSGTGNRTFELGGGTTCWNFQKQTESGRLRAFAKKPALIGSDREGESETSAPFGVVTGCVTD